MNTMQCLLFGVGWFFAAILMGILIRKGFRGRNSNGRMGLLLILFSFVCGISLLGAIIASLS